MTTDKYAEKLVADLWQANTATHEERVAIISAALKRQREACMGAYLSLFPHESHGDRIIKDAILNAEVDEVKE